jgi:MFS family permease
VTVRELVRDRDFGLYLVGQTTSGAGSALSSVALVFAVLSISRSTSNLGLVLLASRLPGVVLSLTGGVIADRWPRQRIAAVTDFARAVLQGCTGALLISGHATIFALVLLQMLAGGASAMFVPAAGALAPTIAPRGHVRRANSLLGMTTAIAQTAGLAVSGALVALTGPGTSLLVDSATFAISAICIARIRARAPAPTRRRGILSDLHDGWNAAIANEWVIVYAVHETIINVLALSPFFVLGPVIAKQHLGGAPAWSAIAIGYVLGNLTAAQITFRWAPQKPVLAAVTVTLGLAPLLALLGLAAPIWLIVPAAFLAGVQSTIYNTVINSTLQSNLPNDVLGRATAITGIGSTVLVPVGMGLAGILATTVGPSTVLTAGAALVIAAATITASLPPVRTQLNLDRAR